MRVAIVGGGIAGLAAAWELRGRADVTIFEPGSLGGCIRTSAFCGKPVDEAADAFLTRVPDAMSLCEEVGIRSELVAPSAGRSMLWWEGRLRSLPAGLVLGVPGQIKSVLASGILSPAGAARASLDLVLPRRQSRGPLTVRELVAGRFGYEVADRLVDPLVGSIYAGWTGNLGAEEVVPQLVAAAARSRSLMLGLRSNAPANGLPLFLAPQTGMGRLVDALGGLLEQSGTTFVSHTVDSVQATGAGVVVEPVGETFDAVVLATPARAAAKVLDAACGEIKTALMDVPTASVALATVAFAGVDLPPDVNGFLVPRGTGWLMTACSFGSNKWPHWSQRNLSVVRMSVGRYGDESALQLDDEDLCCRLTEELGEALGSTLRPVETRVSRWPNSFPQYLPGHASRMADVAVRLGRLLPTVSLAGSSYRGIGIPACIASGRHAARLAFERALSLAT